MKFEERQIRVEYNNVSYVDEGPADGVTIICIHGFPFDKSTWENQINAWKEDYRVIAYDVRGHGKSTADTSQTSITRFASDLFLFMDALGIETAILCGLSMGGYIALNAAITEPARFEALILCDTQCGADSDQARKKRMDTIVSVQKNGLTQYAHDSLQKLFCETSLTDNREAVDFIEKIILHTPQETIVNTLRALADRKETCSELYRINIPVMILVGESDQITSPVLALKMNQLIMGSTLQVIERAGHLSNLENPVTFNGHVQKFLATIQQMTKRL